MPNISIIVPVYKVEKYLRRCIDSILSQTYEGFELILVDDGSPDKCGKICDEYSAKDDRVIVIHQDNRGLSAARNAGISIAKGKYIGFVDSDDYIHENMYEVMYENIEKNNGDIICCGFKMVQENERCETNCVNKKEYELFVMNKEEAIDIMFSDADKIRCYAWNKLYRKEIFSDLRYPEGKAYEDVYIIMDIIGKSNIICAIDYPFYYYLQRQNSIMRSKYSDNDNHYISATENVYNYFQYNYPDKMNKIISYRCSVLLAVLRKMAEAEGDGVVNKVYRKKIVNEIRKNIDVILKDKRYSMTRKIVILALFLNYNLFKIIVSMMK